MRACAKYAGLVVSDASGVNPTKSSGADCANASVNAALSLQGLHKRF